MVKKVQEGSIRFKKVQEVLNTKRRSKNVQEGSQMFKNVKGERVEKFKEILPLILALAV